MAQTIFYFDGVCGLCNGAVDFFIKIDRQQKLRFSPLQSEYASKHLNASLTQNLSTFVLQKGEVVYTKYRAFGMALEEVGGLWGVVGKILRLVPTPLGNFFYDWVAKRRYSFFGKKESCRIPTPEERQRFIF